MPASRIVFDASAIGETLAEQIREVVFLHEIFVADPAAQTKEARALLEAQAAAIRAQLESPAEPEPPSVFLHVTAGSGGDEAKACAAMALRMYLRCCEKTKLTATLLDVHATATGIASAVVQVEGAGAWAMFRHETGTHKYQRYSPFDSSGRRHTSFVRVQADPEVADEVVSIAEADLLVQTFRAGGKGGQHVNKVESAVRMRHIPTGITVVCSAERQQGRNKQTALKLLHQKLEERKKQEQKSSGAIYASFGSHTIVRTYSLQPHRSVVDHRTKRKSGDVDGVLAGNLAQFARAAK